MADFFKYCTYEFYRCFFIHPLYEFFPWFWSDFHMRTFCYSALQSICPSWTHWELRRMTALHGMLSKRQLFNTFISAKLFREELINSLLKPQRFTLVASVPLGLRACLHNHIHKCEILHDCYRVFLKLFAESRQQLKIQLMLLRFLFEQICVVCSILYCECAWNIGLLLTVST